MIAVLPRFAFVALWVCHCFPALADDSAKSIAPPIGEQVEKLDAENTETREAEGAKQEQIFELRKQATDFDRKLQSLTRQLEQIEAEQKKLKAAIPKQEQAAKELLKKQKEAEEAAKKAQELAKKAKKEASDAARKPDESRERLTELDAMLPAIKDALPGAMEDVEKFDKQLDQLGGELQALTRQRERNDSQIESLLKESGDWVSFSDEIAPIFQARCIACHNAQTAKGQYKMTSYHSLMTTGESDGAIDPGDDEFSLLCTMIEDGSMPKDADPLSSAEIQLIKRWVKLGARLDIKSDPHAPLIRIMPRRPQPQPPELYNSPVPVTALAIHPDGEVLASSGYHEVLLWSLEDSQLVRRITNIAERVNGLAFHPDGLHLAVASGTPGRLGEVKLFNIETGEMTADLFIAEDEMFDVEFSPDGARLAACSADGTIAVFDLANRAEPMLLDDHSDWINNIAWSRDGKRLISASRDKTAKVFSAEDGELLMTFNGHGQNVIDAMFLEDGERLASLGKDRHFRVWKLSDGDEVKKVKILDGEPTGLLNIRNHQALIATSEKAAVFDFGKEKKISEFKSDNWIASLASYEANVVVFGTLSGQISIWNVGENDLSKSWIAVPK